MKRALFLTLLLLCGVASAVEYPQRDLNSFKYGTSDIVQLYASGDGDTLASGYTGIDLDSLGGCDHTLTSSDTDYTKITGNTSDDVFCMQDGFSNTSDLTLNFGGSASGASCTTRKYLLRVDSGGDFTPHTHAYDVGAPPQIGGLVLNNADCWVFQGIKVVANGSGDGVSIDGSSINGIMQDFDYDCSDLGNNKDCVSALNGASGWYYQRNHIPLCERQDGNDISGFSLQGSPFYFTGNELKNCTDLLVPACTNGGCRIINNDFAFTSAKYINCSTGVADVNGDCMAAENHVDQKRNNSTTTVYQNNRFRGNRRGASNYGASGGKSGASVLIHSNNNGHAEHVTLERNIWWDFQSAIQLGTSKATDDNDNITIRANLFYDWECHDCDTGKTSFAVSEVGNRADKTLIVFNTFTRADSEADVHIIDALNWMDAHIECNTITDSAIDFDGHTLGSGTIDRWAYYDTPDETPEGSNNVTSADGLGAEDFTDYTLRYDFITGPSTRTFVNVVPLSSVPTAMKNCDTTFTAGYGDG